MRRLWGGFTTGERELGISRCKDEPALKSCLRTGTEVVFSAENKRRNCANAS